MAQLAYGFRERPDVRYGLTALCVGMGMGAAAACGRTLAPVTEFKLARAGDVALVTIDNGEDWTKPTFFGEAALESLDRLLGELEGGDFRAAVITGKPFFFAAGADITEFPDITRERAIEGARAGHELFGRLRALPFPTVAAINGACLGGGVELALHCTARTISTAVRHFAFPEVFLGLFPAWGGTQLLPRLVGPETAIKVIVSNPLRQNRMLTRLAGRRARHRRPAPRAGGVRRRVAGVRARARRPAARAARAGLVRRGDGLPPRAHGRRRHRSRRSAGAVRRARPDRGRAAVDDRGGLPPRAGSNRRAPARPAGAGVDLRVRARRAAGEEASGSPDRRAAAESRKVGIVGAGLMARQIATLFLRRLEVPIVIRDVKQEIVDEALADIRAEIDGQVAKGRYDEGKGRFLVVARLRQHRLRRLRRLRPRARGGVRGARDQEAGVRRARRGRARRVRARDEHLGPVDHGHGRRPAPARTRRRHALLQSGRR